MDSVKNEKKNMGGQGHTNGSFFSYYKRDTQTDSKVVLFVATTGGYKYRRTRKLGYQPPIA
jgi:hypothetical protein